MENLKVSNQTDNRAKEWLWLAGIIIIVILAYLPNFTNGFTNWDDIQQVTGNNDIKSLSFQNIKKIFSSFYVGMYQPIPTLLYSLIYSIFQLNPLGFHSLSIFIHCINVILVYCLIRNISANMQLSVFVSVLFALTPLNVEAVAWVSALSTLTFSCFYLFSLNYYTLYLKTSNKKGLWYLSLAFFILALLSKSAAVTLPILFFLFDYFFKRSFSKKLILEKLPFFILAIVFGIMTIFSRKEAAHIIDISTRFNLIDRFFIFNHSLFIYIAKLIIPVKLSAFHPYPVKTSSLLPYIYYFTTMVLIVGIYGVYKVKNYRKQIIFGLLFFIITISVMMEIIPVGIQVIKERYTYISSIGIYFCLGIIFCCLVNGNKSLKILRISMTMVVVVTFFVITFLRTKTWENSHTLWDDVIKKYPNISAAYINRGNAYSIEGNYSKAIEDYSLAIRYEPTAGDAYIDRAMIYTRLEQFNEALSDYTSAINIGKVDYNIYVSRGLLKNMLNDPKGAINDMSSAIRLNPNEAILYNQRGIFYGMIGNYSLAISDFAKAVSLKPDYAEAYVNKGNAELQLDRLMEAINDYTQSISLNPNLASAFYYRGMTNVKLNKNFSACNDFKSAYQLGLIEAQSEILKYCK